MKSQRLAPLLLASAVTFASGVAVGKIGDQSPTLPGLETAERIASVLSRVQEGIQEILKGLKKSEYGVPIPIEIDYGPYTLRKKIVGDVDQAIEDLLAEIHSKCTVAHTTMEGRVYYTLRKNVVPLNPIQPTIETYLNLSKPLSFSEQESAAWTAAVKRILIINGYSRVRDIKPEEIPGALHAIVRGIIDDEKKLNDPLWRALLDLLSLPPSTTFTNEAGEVTTVEDGPSAQERDRSWHKQIADVLDQLRIKLKEGESPVEAALGLIHKKAGDEVHSILLAAVRRSSGIDPKQTLSPGVVKRGVVEISGEEALFDLYPGAFAALFRQLAPDVQKAFRTLSEAYQETEDPEAKKLLAAQIEALLRDANFEKVSGGGALLCPNPEHIAGVLASVGKRLDVAISFLREDTAKRAPSPAIASNGYSSWGELYRYDLEFPQYNGWNGWNGLNGWDGWNGLNGWDGWDDLNPTGVTGNPLVLASWNPLIVGGRRPSGGSVDGGVGGGPNDGGPDDGGDGGDGGGGVDDGGDDGDPDDGGGDDGDGGGNQPPPINIPTPSTLALLGAGLAGLFNRRRRRRK